eukprot:maker-scaffold183_size276960-snap-gene-1.29 protein:Tk01764 transcript:maker-scaffold183_size276960-snap-gene-1.29-mRNA-1 annotation:"ccaat enhancer-binding protein gamma"
MEPWPIRAYLIRTVEHGLSSTLYILYTEASKRRLLPFSKIVQYCVILNPNSTPNSADSFHYLTSAGDWDSPTFTIEEDEAMGSRKNAPGNNPDTEYQSRRARNNEAVKRSREKARQRAKETHERVSKLKTENEMLEERIKLLSKELTFLKDIFMAHAGSSHGLCLDDLDIKNLLNEDEDDQFSNGSKDQMNSSYSDQSNSQPGLY